MRFLKFNILFFAFTFNVLMPFISSIAFEITLNEQVYNLMKQGAYVDSYRLSQKAIELAIKNNDKIELARAYSNQASNLHYLGENLRALELYSKSLKIAESSLNHDGVLRALNNISGIYRQLDKTSEAFKYRQRHYAIAKENGDDEDLLISYVGLIGSFTLPEDQEESKKILLLAKEVLAKLKNQFLEIYLLIAEAALLESNDRFQEALLLQNRALKLAKDNNYEGIYVSVGTNIAKSLTRIQECDKTINMASEILPFAEKLKLKVKQVQLHQLLAECFEEKKEYHKALTHSREAGLLSLSISGHKIQILAEITKIERQTEETKSQLLQSKNDQKILSLQLDQQKQNQIFWLITFSCIFIFIFLLHYRRISIKEITRQRDVNRRLKELDRVKDRILKNTSHELRTPLNGIVGLSEVIIADNENKIEKSTLDMIRLIKSSGEQLSLIINDILEMSKSKSGTITIVNTDFNLVALISDVIKICEPLALEKNIEINFPQSKEEEIVFLDKTRLQQILFNIIGNAVKFTNVGSVSVEYSIEEYGVKISVLDTGIGIPENKIERILEGFEQVDSSDSRANSGSGLGLAISRNICLALGGKLEISSNINVGSKVTMTLPFVG